jgi:hypothetical protein
MIVFTTTGVIHIVHKGVLDLTGCEYCRDKGFVNKDIDNACTR